MYCLQALLGAGVSGPSQAVSVLKDVPKDLSQAAQKGCCPVWREGMLSKCSQPHGLYPGSSLKAALCRIAPPGTWAEDGE